MSAEGNREGKVVQVIGPAIDIEFAGGELPEIYNAVNIHFGDEGMSFYGKDHITVEVAQHLGENRVRTIAMEPSDGLVRGMKATDTGGPITMPVGPGVLGRVLNVLGDPIDNLGEVP
ncbi:MAG: F0F1 ATP synthase subunit beta, partial [bacterium]